MLEGHADEVLAVAFDAGGGVFASGGGARDRTVRLWDVRTHKLIGTPLRGHTDSVASVAFSPDGQTLASGGWDGSLRLWSVRTHRQLGKPLRG
jgi:WD40 repeat protein